MIELLAFYAWLLHVFGHKIIIWAVFGDWALLNMLKLELIPDVGLVA